MVIRPSIYSTNPARRVSYPDRNLAGERSCRSLRISELERVSVRKATRLSSDPVFFSSETGSYTAPVLKIGSREIRTPLSATRVSSSSSTARITRPANCLTGEVRRSSPNRFNSMSLTAATGGSPLSAAPLSPSAHLRKGEAPGSPDRNALPPPIAALASLTFASVLHILSPDNTITTTPAYQPLATGGCNSAWAISHISGVVRAHLCKCNDGGLAL